MSIIAEKIGASEIDAVDIKYNCIENAIENIKRNSCKKINTKICSSQGLLGKTYDLILSNITLNNLKDNFKNFKNLAEQNTILIISGFYEKDLKNVNQILENFGFELLEYKIKNRWVASNYCYN